MSSSQVFKIENFVVVVPAGVSVDVIKANIEKDLKLTVMQIAIAGPGLSILGTALRYVYQDQAGPFSGRPGPSDGTTTYAITAMMDISAGIDFVDQMIKDAKAAVEAKARLEATVAAKEASRAAEEAVKKAQAALKDAEDAKKRLDVLTAPVAEKPKKREAKE
jgi:hypothetical protein